MQCGACRAIPKVNMLWLDAFGSPKNPGGYRSFQALEGNSHAILLDAVNKPLFMHCGACRAIPKVNMLWLDAFGTPKNPGRVSELSGPRR